MLVASAGSDPLTRVPERWDTRVAMGIAMCIAVPPVAALLAIAVDCISSEQKPVELFKDWNASNPIHSVPRTPRITRCERRSSGRIPDMNTFGWPLLWVR